MPAVFVYNRLVSPLAEACAMDSAAAPVKLNFATEWKYAPAPESPSHVRLKERYDLFVNGKFVAPSTGKYFETLNPASEKRIGEVAQASTEDVDKAVRAARNAYEKVWGRMHPRER